MKARRQKVSNFNDSTSLSDRVQEIVLGSLLGDGSLKIHKGYANARFSFRHSAAAAGYFHWKARQLAEIAAENSEFVQPPDGFSRQPKLRFQSRALPGLTELYHLTHRQHHFSIRRKWLNRLSPLSLAIWWLDDGSLISGTRKGVICTDGFDQDSVKRIARYLQVEWNVQSHVAAVGRKRAGRQDQYWRLWIRSTDELKRFLRIILPHVHVEDMLYKVLILYRDPQLQQRWISEVHETTGFPIERITQVVAERKSRLKSFPGQS
jgi:hypothetical protein